MGSVGEEKKFVFEAQHRRQVHDFFDCPEYWHVSHQTVKDKILFKIKWSPTAADDHATAAAPGDADPAAADHGRGPRRSPAPAIDARRVDDAAAPARPPGPSRREPEPLSEMEALRRAQEASLAEARARAAGNARADQFEQDVVAQSYIAEQNAEQRRRNFRENNANAQRMAVTASLAAFQ